jgi:hypothetical protein
LVKGTYSLSELDRTELAETFARNRLEKHVQRSRYFYSPEDDFKKGNEREEDHSEGSKTEAEGARDEERESVTVGVNKEAGVIVRVLTLPEEERRKYVRFEED